MTVVAKSDLSTGNSMFASYVLQSHDLVRPKVSSLLHTFTTTFWKHQDASLSPACRIVYWRTATHTLFSP